MAAMILFGSEAFSATVGPVYPAPGGNGFSSNGGNTGLGTGRENTYDTFDQTFYDQLWWGPAEVKASMDGAIDTVGETLIFSSLSGSGLIATWTGQTNVLTSTGSQTVYTKFTATIVSGATGWIAPGSAGIGIGPLNALQVAEITGSSFVVNMLFEASFASGGGYTPFLTFYDSNGITNGLAIRNVNGGFYSTPAVPLPAPILLLGSAIFGLGVVARFRRREPLSTRQTSVRVTP